MPFAELKIATMLYIYMLASNHKKASISPHSVCDAYIYVYMQVRALGCVAHVYIFIYMHAPQERDVLRYNDGEG